MGFNHIGVNLLTISKADFKNEAVHLLSFDADISGDNGDEYTWQDAKSNGYSSTAEYIVDKCVTAMGESKNTLYSIVRTAIEHDSYYLGWEMEVIEEEDRYIVAIGTAS